MSKKQEITFIQPQDDPMFLVCMDYLQAVEFNHMTMGDFAAKHNIHDATLFRWRIQWERSGLLAKCRETMGIILFEDVRIETRRMVRAWGRSAAELVRLSVEARREDVRLGAIQTLWREFIKPEMDRQVDPGSEEQDYLDFIIGNTDALDPMSVTHLLDETVDDVAQAEIEDSVQDHQEEHVE